MGFATGMGIPTDIENPDVRSPHIPCWKIQGGKPGESALQAHPEETILKGNTNNSLKELAIWG